MYMVELAPPLYRGTVAGLYNTLYYMGSIIATFGKSDKSRDASEYPLP